MSIMLTDSDLTVDDLMNIRDTIDDQIAAVQAASPDYSPGDYVPTASPKADEVVEVTEKTVKVGRRRRAKGLKRVTRKVAKTGKNAGRSVEKTTKSVVYKARKAGRTGWESTKRGVVRARRATAAFGRKMWRRVVGAAKWSWGKARWAGRKLAGVTSWLLKGSGRLVRWTMGNLGWGWALIGVGGVILVTLVAWGVSTMTRSASTPLEWVSKGRPGSLKGYKDAKRAKDLVRQSKKHKAHAEALDKQSKHEAKVASKIDQQVAKTAAKVTKQPVPEFEQDGVVVGHKPEQQVSEVVASDPVSQAVETLKAVDGDVEEALQRVDEAEMAEMEHGYALLILKAAQRNYDGLTLGDVYTALQQRLLKLDEENAPKDVFGEAAGRFFTVAALYDLDVDEKPTPLRGKPLYQVLRKEAIKEYSEKDATPDESYAQASKKIGWTRFQKGMDEEIALLEQYGLIEEDSD